MFWVPYGDVQELTLVPYAFRPTLVSLADNKRYCVGVKESATWYERKQVYV